MNSALVISLAIAMTSAQSAHVAYLRYKHIAIKSEYYS